MLFILCLAIFANSQSEGSVWDNVSAKIAVVEYQPVDDSQSDEARVLKNTIQYVKEVFAQQDALDMIIFPESTLGMNSVTAPVEVNLNTTCDTIKCPDLLDTLSFAARTRKVYIVVNLVEKAKCDQSDQSENCKAYGFHYYNTDVVFDRSGRIINRYRKYNLFGEITLDQPEKPEHVIIETDFGVKFGIFTCFDILFKSPAQDLVEAGVDGIIFPTMWFSELPFLTAVQTQQMFAHTHNIFFFGAGANNPQRGSGGTGVYRGANGTVEATIVAKGGKQTIIYDNSAQTRTIAEDVDFLAKDMDGFYLKRDGSIDDYQSVVLNTSLTDFGIELCHVNGLSNQTLCCDFTVKMSTTTPQANLDFYTYRLVAFSGVRSFDGVYNGGIEVCGVIACLNSSLSSCGYRFPDYDNVQWPVTFQEITIKGKFDKSENKTQFPSSLLSSIRPLDATTTLWSGTDVGNNLVEKTFATTEEQNRLLTFGIYGRNFEQDSPPAPAEDTNSDNHKNSAEILQHQGFIISFCLILSLVMYNM